MARDDSLYRALLARDPRFDGKFFVGVRTTGVYCRPICPARPRRENVEFFPSARHAERAGYRPCLRCRPEAAPLSPAWAGASGVVQRALRLLSLQGAEGDGGRPGSRREGEEAFAARFGLSARHLRRLFEREVGRSPTRILLEGRLDFARKLVVETRLPLSDIAFAAGFGSVRRFNEAMRDRFRRPPTRLRLSGARGARARSASGKSPEPGLELSLAYRPPLAFAEALAYYRSHAIPGLEAFPAGPGGKPLAYERLFRLDGKTGLVRVTQDGDGNRLRLRVLGGSVRSLARLVRAARRLFDLDADPLLLAEAFAACPPLERLRRRNPGLRCPRGWDPWETCVSAVLGQLVSIPRANALVAQLLAAHGEPVAHPLTGAESRLFPAPAALAEASLDAVGTTRARKAALRELARRVADGRIHLGGAQDPEGFRAALRAVPGIGPWTSEYLALRAIDDTDAFPATDLVLGRALAEDPRLDLERVRPWRGYAAAHLWRAWAEGKAGNAKATPEAETGRRGRRKQEATP